MTWYNKNTCISKLQVKVHPDPLIFSYVTCSIETIWGNFSGNSDHDSAWICSGMQFFNRCQQSTSTHWRNVTFLDFKPLESVMPEYACVAFRFILISVSQISVYFNIPLLASSFSPHGLTPPLRDSLEDCCCWHHSKQMSSNCIDSAMWRAPLYVL